MSYDLITVGGESKSQNSYLHDIPLIDFEGKVHVIQAYQIDDICGKLQDIDISAAAEYFKVSMEDVQRPVGPVDLLVGIGLVLYMSIFGTRKIIGGCHHYMERNDKLHPFVDVVAHAKIANTRVMFSKDGDPGVDFFTSEGFGVMLPPSCDRCKSCKNCTSENHQLSKEEQRELQSIRTSAIQLSWKTTENKR